MRAVSPTLAPLSTRPSSPLFMLVLLVVALSVAAAQSTLNATCVLDDFQAVESCFDANVIDDPCSSCSIESASAQLTYSSYDRPFFLLPTSSSIGRCEPASSWICPPQDNGHCCVRQATLARTNSFRALCARQSTSISNGLTDGRLPKAAVLSAVAGARVPIDTALTVGSAFYIRGRWGQGAGYSLSFFIGSNGSNEEVVVVFNRLNGLVTATSDGSTVSSALSSLSDEEDFNVTVQFQWRCWDVYVNGTICPTK